MASLTATEKFAIEGITKYNNGFDGDEVYHPLYKAWRSYNNDPGCLKEIRQYREVALGLSTFLSYGTITDIDIQQQVVSIAYLFISKAILQNPANANLYKDRLFLLHFQNEAFLYTVSSVVNKDYLNDFMSIRAGMNTLHARKAICNMQYSDLYSNPVIAQYYEVYANLKKELEDRISNGYFGNQSNRQSVAAEGIVIHKNLYDYLHDKVIVNEDIDFS